MAKGKKTGGRQKGVRNKRTEAQSAAIENSGLTPLEYMLSVLRDLTHGFTAVGRVHLVGAPVSEGRRAAGGYPEGAVPNFFVYMAWVLPQLLPLFILVTLIIGV